MTNNDIIRRVRYTFDFDDTKMIELFASGGLEVNRAQISNWLKPLDNTEAWNIYDDQLAAFLNGFINEKRGKREGSQPEPEKMLNNNTILRKFKIALNLRDEEMLDILMLADMYISKHELSAFFRKPGQSQYRECKDQILRKFLHGMQIKYRDSVQWT